MTSKTFVAVFAAICSCFFQLSAQTPSANQKTYTQAELDKAVADAMRAAGCSTTPRRTSAPARPSAPRTNATAPVACPPVNIEGGITPEQLKEILDTIKAQPGPQIMVPPAGEPSAIEIAQIGVLQGIMKMLQAPVAAPPSPVPPAIDLTPVVNELRRANVIGEKQNQILQNTNKWTKVLVIEGAVADAGIVYGGVEAHRINHKLTLTNNELGGINNNIVGLQQQTRAMTDGMMGGMSSFQSTLQQGFAGVQNGLGDLKQTVQTGDNNIVGAVNNDTDKVVGAVNKSGDKVAGAVKANGDQVVGAVNANGDKVVGAVNANGDKVVGAVNANGDKVVGAVNASGGLVANTVTSTGAALGNQLSGSINVGVTALTNAIGNIKLPPITVNTTAYGGAGGSGGSPVVTVTGTSSSSSSGGNSSASSVSQGGNANATGGSSSASASQNQGQGQGQGQQQGQGQGQSQSSSNSNSNTATSSPSQSQSQSQTTPTVPKQ